MADATKATLVKLLELKAELMEKVGAIDAEIKALICGEDGIGKKLKACEAFFSDCRAERYPEAGPYQFNFKEDRPHLKRWLQDFTVGEIQARMFTYLRDTDDFVVRNKHPFRLFVRGFNSYVGLPKSDDGGQAMQRQREMRGE